MVSLKGKKQGFTIVELLIVIVVIAILATLVIVTFTGIQQKARDNQRQTDIAALNNHLAAYYAANGNYPTLANLQDSDWVRDNMKGLDPEALLDPRTDNTEIQGAVSDTDYGYVQDPATCDNTATGGQCTGYTLTANLEAGDDETFEKSSN